jgi:hypothetical protein
MRTAQPIEDGRKCVFVPASHGSNLALNRRSRLAIVLVSAGRAPDIARDD